MIGAEPPTLHQREASMNPGQHDVAGDLTDGPRVVSVIGEPGIRSVAVGEQRWASSWTADMPFECVAMRRAAQNHTVSGNLDRCIAGPAVIDVWRPQSRHS